MTKKVIGKLNLRNFAGQIEIIFG